MSAALLKKSLSLCDGINKSKTNSKKLKKQQARVTQIGKKCELKSDRKLSVIEARQQLKSQEETLKSNIQMLKKAKKACKVKLSKEITDQFLERATSRKYTTPKEIEINKEETVFTEEDFNKFQEDYIVE